MNRDKRDQLAQPPASGGERADDRDVIDRMTKRMMSSGVPSDVAQREARQSMTRVDRKLRDEGRR